MKAVIAGLIAIVIGVYTGGNAVEALMDTELTQPMVEEIE